MVGRRPDPKKIGTDAAQGVRSAIQMLCLLIFLETVSFYFCGSTFLYLYRNKDVKITPILITLDSN